VPCLSVWIVIFYWFFSLSITFTTSILISTLNRPSIPNRSHPQPQIAFGLIAFSLNSFSKQVISLSCFVAISFYFPLLCSDGENGSFAPHSSLHMPGRPPRPLYLVVMAVIQLKKNIWVLPSKAAMGYSIFTGFELLYFFSWFLFYLICFKFAHKCLLKYLRKTSLKGTMFRVWGLRRLSLTSTFFQPQNIFVNMWQSWSSQISHIVDMS